MQCDIQHTGPGPNPPLAELFRSTFTASEGAEEGAMIGTLVQNLLTTDPADLHVFTGVQNGTLVAGALFSRLWFSDDKRSVVILSPMAVAPAHQRQGIGQALIRAALTTLKHQGTDAAFTYGDPKYYGQVGFAPVDAAQAAPPLPLSQPIGWIGQSLTDQPLLPLKGTCTCVPALNDPALW